jgi:hydrogenase maturation factor
MCCVPEAEVGDFVVVHAGIAISKVNAESAAKMLEQISQVDWDEFEKEAKS